MCTFPLLIGNLRNQKESDGMAHSGLFEYFTFIAFFFANIQKLVRFVIKIIKENAQNIR